MKTIFPILILTTSIALTSCYNSGSNEVSSNESSSNLAYADEFDKNQIMEISVSADSDEWQNMLDNASDEEYIPADITINGTTIENVDIRPKGNSSLSSIARDNETQRYSFKIKFDEYVDGQTWLGFYKLVLNNNYSDPTSMKEYISYDIMNYIGVDTPLYSYADISVNGETWGFYLALEDIDSSFLKRTENNEGELYKPETSDLNADDMPTDSTGDTQMPEKPDGMGGGMMGSDSNGISLVYTDDNEDSYSAIFDNAETKTDSDDHAKVIKAIKNLNSGTDLEKYVDIDAQLRYLATQTVVVTLDSYSSQMAHNYYLYENNGQISMLPWDYNMAFGGFMSSNATDVVNFPIDIPISGVTLEERPMIGKLLEVPEYKEQYHEYL